ncbi:MAG: homocysteine biosynthesis protein, partial [Cyanobacteria bacterium P01_H01_bin.130]
RVRPTFNSVSYAQLKSGEISIEGQRVRTAPLSSVYLARQVSEELKGWIQAGKFELTASVAPLPSDRTFIPQDRWGSQITLDS